MPQASGEQWEGYELPQAALRGTTSRDQGSAEGRGGLFVGDGGGWLPATDATVGVCGPAGSSGTRLPTAWTPSGWRRARGGGDGDPPLWG